MTKFLDQTDLKKHHLWQLRARVTELLVKIRVKIFYLHVKVFDASKAPYQKLKFQKKVRAYPENQRHMLWPKKE